MKRSERKGRVGIVRIFTFLLTISIASIVSMGIFLIDGLTHPNAFLDLPTLSPYRPGMPDASFADAESSIPIAQKSLADVTLHSPSAILIRLSDGNTMMACQQDQSVYPASLTKIMTALIALESIEDLQTEIRLPEEIFPMLYDENASMAGFLPGERVRGIDLLYAAMLPSGADASLGLVESIAGTERAFVEAMNRRATELGMMDTHFANATGLHDENHVTTVCDMSRLLAHALDNKTFRAIFTTARYSMPPTNLHRTGITVRSTLSQAITSWSFPGGELLGGKTGYTSQAGLCLASLAVKDGEEYILVTAGAAGDHHTEPFHVLDALSVYESI